jgi:glycopeptide antibiotics resistance protein
MRGSPDGPDPAGLHVPRGTLALRKTLTALLLTGYTAVLSYLTLLPQTTHPLPRESALRLVPLGSIAEFLAAGGWPMLVNVVGNLAAFVPLGILWPLLREGRTTARRVGLLAFSVSLLIETLQYGSGRRIADVDDVLLNTAGGLLGYGTYLALRAGFRIAASVVLRREAVAEGPIAREG